MKAIAMGFLALAAWAQGGQHYTKHSRGGTDLTTCSNCTTSTTTWTIVNPTGDATIVMPAWYSDPICALPKKKEYIDRAGLTCIEYIDETGQRVGVLARKPKAKLAKNQITATDSGSFEASPSQIIDCTDGACSGYPTSISFAKRDKDVDDFYLRLDMDVRDYSIKTATFRLPTSTVTLTGEQLTQACTAWVARPHRSEDCHTVRQVLE